MQRAVRFLALALLVVLVACGGASTPPNGPVVGLPLVSPSASPLPVAPKYVAGSSETDAAVAIEIDDPVWGARDALVTIVEFSDFQCPYCSKAYGTVEQLLKEYGPNTVRLVFKNEPLPFHPMARPTAEAAVTVRGLGGNDAFWSFYRSAFEEQKDLSAAAIDRWVSRSGVALNVFHDALASHRFTDKVDRDHALAQKVGVNGTPAFYINGVPLVGAQPYEKFKELIEAELGKAKEALGKGVTADRLYRTLAAQNFKVPADDDDEHEDTTTVWRVPIGTSPTLGPATALVTIVEFSDFQCPFCKRSEPTLKALRAKYGNDLRLVWKNEPLPFHVRAAPAALFALEARAEKGDAGFWDAHDRLFDLPVRAAPPPPPSPGPAPSGAIGGATGGAGTAPAHPADPPRPDDTDLDAIARAMGLNLAKTRDAVAKKKYEKVLDEDSDLGDDVNASGTPHFFINGRRLVGAQPVEKFVPIIDEEIAKGRKLLAAGTAATAVYDELMKAGKTPPPPERHAVSAVVGAPIRGAANAPVTIIEFSDFQCPYCKRAEETLAEVLKNYAGKVRLQWRNFPLKGMHPKAELAAEAGMEAYKQKGNDGFWKMHDLLYANAADTDGLERAKLDGYAKIVGLDPKRFAAALDGASNAATVDADLAAGQALQISGTPHFFINGFVLSGAQPYAKFRRFIDMALAESAAGKKP